MKRSQRSQARGQRPEAKHVESSKLKARSAAQTWAYIALGSNLGDGHQNVLQAIEYLQKLSDYRLLKSSLWKTTPVDCPPGSPEFVNAVVAVIPRANETPESFLEKL